MSAEVFQHLPLPLIDLMAFILGLNVGSFLNVLALRSLAGQSFIFPASHCPACKHRLGILDTLPVLSYCLLRARCRYCSAKIHWQYPLVELCTAVTFVLIERLFLTAQIAYDPTATGGLWTQIALSGQAQTASASFLPLDIRIGLTIGMTLFACTLIAVTVTDFREKLIPHEITYPSMVLGIIFSAWRGDLGGALIGIGASYMLFDFLAFYGLKLYDRLHADDDCTDQEDLASDAEDALDDSRIARASTDEEPLEVMGGGDAVLSAVMSAYLGWQLLLVALCLGFVAGTVMGLGLLFKEMQKAKLFEQCARRAAIYALCGGAAFGLLAATAFSFIASDTKSQAITAGLELGALGAVTGALIAVVSVGTKVSKPFPFGPALALGGMVAMFWLPYWLQLYVR